ncbi:MAG: hypothetical protein NTW87_06955 [Planctomycetota bacterium]|nr:hypothetical protein [Planctomycetota bacterium]
MFTRNLWAWGLSVAIVAGAIIMALRAERGGPAGLRARNFAADPQAAPAGRKPDVVPQNVPVVTGFVGDLAVGGNKRNDGTKIPFVIGDILTLEAEALNAIEYRWTVNGEALNEKGQEWSVRKDREYEVATAGELRVSVQVRGSDPALVSQPKQVTIRTEPLFVESFEKNIVEEDDRCLTGEDYTVEVTLAEPMTAGPDFYLLRYSVNDVPVQHPDDGKEWTTERDFTYTFPAPGQYSFKVEVRRATEKHTERTQVLAETIVVADAVLLTFDVFPSKYAPLGTTVQFDVFPASIFGKSECRFGVKNVNAADFEWIPDEDGSVWGAAERSWLPREPGNYILRAEIREPGKARADDYREILYTVTTGDF